MPFSLEFLFHIAQNRKMPANTLVGVTPTSAAPKSISDLEVLLKDDIKVKVAGWFCDQFQMDS